MIRNYNRDKKTKVRRFCMGRKKAIMYDQQKKIGMGPFKQSIKAPSALMACSYNPLQKARNAFPWMMSHRLEVKRRKMYKTKRFFLYHGPSSSHS